MSKKALVANLNNRQRTFCEEYVIDFNGNRAAIAAGYSEKTAREQASKLLTKPNIADYLEMLAKKKSEESGVSAQMVIDELCKIAFCTESDFFHPDTGRLLQPHELGERAAAAVSGFKTSLNVTGKGDKKEIERIDEYKRYDKTKALELLGRHVGAFEKDNKQKAANINVLGFNAFYNEG